MSAPAWDFSTAEAGIVDRVKAIAQTGPAAWARTVETRAALAEVAEEMQVTPAVYVVYDGYAVLAADEFSATLLNRWLIVLAIKSSAQQRESAARNQAAGPLLRQLFSALHGHTPPDCTSALIPITPPRPYYGATKFAYFPLAFTCESYSCKAQH